MAAVALWLVLLVSLRRPLPAVGAAFMVTVSTESLAVLGVDRARLDHAHRLLVVSLAPFVLGPALYPFVLARFDLRELAIGRGDHWVSGGALAICALAAASITSTADALGMLGGEERALKDLSLALWTLAMLWLPALVLAEALHPRLRYDVRRWSTVFPVGMYAACSFAVGDAAGAPAITGFARADLGGRRPLADRGRRGADVRSPVKDDQGSPRRALDDVPGDAPNAV